LMWLSALFGCGPSSFTEHRARRVWLVPSGREVVMAPIPGASRSERRSFVRHFLEMVAAMFAGMAVLGGLVSLFCALTGHEDLLEHAGVSAPIMATDMTGGMAGWMCHRRHGWAPIVEM